MEKINCRDAKGISLTSILEKIGISPIKRSGEDIWYLSPFRKENTPSFKINAQKNIFYDFGEGFGGNILDFVMRYNNCNLKEALLKLSDDQNTFSFHQPTNFKNAGEIKKKYEIRQVCDNKNGNLKQYLASRGLCFKTASKYCCEIHYNLNSKKYYAIGFKNDEDGFEVRNKYVKMALGKKEITTIKNNQNKVILFESWSDFVSFLTLYPEQESQHDFIILNSVSMLEKTLIQLYNCINVELYNCIKTSLYNYISIVCCFDNDEAGNRATLKVQQKFPSLFKDGRVRYKNHKDLNDYLIATRTNIGLRYIDGRD